MRQGADALIVTTGVMLKRGLDAAAQLSAKGIEAAVLHVPTIKPLDQAALLELAAPVPVVVTVEEHTINGGLGSAVAEILAEGDFAGPKRLKRIGIPDVFPDKYGSQDSLLARYNITPEGICTAVEGLLSKKENNGTAQEFRHAAS